MRIWVKLLAGSLIGVLVAFLLPSDGGESLEVMDFLSHLAINLGRYVVFPLVLFSLAVGTNELKREKKTLRVYGRTVLYLVLASALLSIIGAVSVVLFAPARIPIIIEEEVIFSLPSIKEILLTVFPKNLFLVFGGNGSFILPLYFLAFFLGLNLTFDRLVTRPVVQFFDSLSRILYHMNSFFLEIAGLGMVAICAFLVMQLRGAPELGLFSQLLALIGIDTFVVLVIVFPAILYFLTGKSNPYKWLYAVLAPALCAFVSGDGYFTLGVLLRNGKENLGIPRKVGAATFPLFALFGRAGTAMVTSVSFILILRSYSSLGVSFPEMVWVVVFSFLVSFALGSVPGMGAFVSLSVLSTLYGGGYQEGYLILKPIAPLLISFGVMLDVVTSSFASMLVARHEGMQKEIVPRDLI